MLNRYFVKKLSWRMVFFIMSWKNCCGDVSVLFHHSVMTKQTLCAQMNNFSTIWCWMSTIFVLFWRTISLFLYTHENNPWKCSLTHGYTFNALISRAEENTWNIQMKTTLLFNIKIESQHDTWDTTSSICSTRLLTKLNPV